MRSYGSIPPTLTTNVQPGIGAVTGLGTGGGAGIMDAPFAFLGDIELYTGSNPATSGSVVLAFASAPPALFIAGSDKFGTLAQATVGNNVTISWTGATLKPNHSFPIHYEPFVSS